jgi:hypothetical protein
MNALHVAVVAAGAQLFLHVVVLVVAVAVFQHVAVAVFQYAQLFLHALHVLAVEGVQPFVVALAEEYLCYVPLFLVDFHVLHVEVGFQNFRFDFYLYHGFLFLCPIDRSLHHFHL